MAYTNKEKEKIFSDIIKLITQGRSFRKAKKEIGKPGYETFFKWLKEDKDKAKQYARACEERADKIFDEILDISDNNDKDEKAFVGVNHIHRDKLRIDARKWILAKMVPKKYGDNVKIDHGSSDGSMSPKETIIQVVDEKAKDEHKKMIDEND